MTGLPLPARSGYGTSSAVNGVGFATPAAFWFAVRDSALYSAASQVPIETMAADPESHLFIASG